MLLGLWLWDSAKSAFQAAITWAFDQVRAIAELMWGAFQWIAARLGELLCPLISEVIGWLPVLPEWSSDVIGVLEIANSWAPVAEAFLFLGSYYTFVAVVASVRAVLKVIPTIG